MANCEEYQNFIFGMLIEISFPEDAFLHFISVQFKNSCSSDGRRAAPLKILKISVSIKVGLPPLLGLAMRYHIEKLEFQKIGKFR